MGLAGRSGNGCQLYDQALPRRLGLVREFRRKFPYRNVFFGNLASVGGWFRGFFKASGGEKGSGRAPRLNYERGDDVVGFKYL